VPPVSNLPEVVGVVGAGTMGAGIAQLAATAGARTLLHDPVAEALQRGLEGIRRRFERSAARGRLSEGDARAAAGRLEAVGEIEALAPCGLVIEAAPERLELKRELFAAIAAVVAEDALLATNTSSLSVTAIAAGLPRPERVVGMHFFNPPPVMKLVEVVAGDATAPEAVRRARAAGEAMGRHPIEAADVAGFLVNRCNRPFGLEALRLVQERIATPEQVDRICRLGGGFRMGPFELMDLVGIDVGFEIARSFYDQSFGEPRWRPSPLAERMTAAGRHGRKTGHGWYRYPQDGGPYRPEDAPPPEPIGGDGVVAILGDSPLTAELRTLAGDAGWEVSGGRAALIVDCQPPDAPGSGAAGRGSVGRGAAGSGAARGGRSHGEAAAAGDTPRIVLCAAAPLAALDPDAVGFYAAPPLGTLVELTRGPRTTPAAASAAERFFGSLGRHVEWVRDAPGLVLGRIVCQVVNEACFALGEGIGTAEDIDVGMVLGLNHPRGPVEWGDAIGAAGVLAVVDGLQREYREERYRPAPALLRAARGAQPLGGQAVNA
jgi:3-hydroxybutyryl-CoA dehydrogenase